jgi:hypothetical protein
MFYRTTLITILFIVNRRENPTFRSVYVFRPYILRRLCGNCEAYDEPQRIWKEEFISTPQEGRILT